jgi:hypothetical protein
MANASKIEQEVKNVYKNELGVNLDIDLSQVCAQSTDARQMMKNIKIKGVVDAEFSQLNKVNNLCALKAILDQEMFNQLSAKSQADLFQKLQQEGGLSVNVSDQSSKVINEIENKVNLEAAINMSKKCLTETLQTQEMSNISVADSKNIKFGQMNSGFNQCITDSAVKIATDSKVDLASVAKMKAEVKQKGFDPLGFLGGLLGLGLLPLLSPLIISSCVVIGIVIFTMLPGGGGDTGDTGFDVNEGLETGLEFGEELFGGGEGATGQIITRTDILLKGVTNWLGKL